jgi:hypothetical protein
MTNLYRKPSEKEIPKPAKSYSYPQLALKPPALAPGQYSIGTRGQYSIGADSGACGEFSIYGFVAWVMAS